MVEWKTDGRDLNGRKHSQNLICFSFVVECDSDAMLSLRNISTLPNLKMFYLLRLCNDLILYVGSEF
jgi:hypothetical protein